MQYEMGVFLRQEWTDERLDFTHLNFPRSDHITFDSSLIEHLWIPDLWFMHSAGERRHNVVRENQLLR